jgi:hypothetical protein
MESDDPPKLWELASDKASDRKLRLLAVAFCRCAWPLLTDERSQAAVEVAERYADGNASEDERVEACLAANSADVADVDSPAAQAAVHAAMMSHHLHISCEAACEALLGPDGDELNEELADIVRDIFGPSHRPVMADPAWLTSTVVQLATAIYDERGFDRLPILADALEDYGCTDSVILDHLRGPGPHVRGCWALDLLLDKK